MKTIPIFIELNQLDNYSKEIKLLRAIQQIVMKSLSKILSNSKWCKGR